MKNIALFITIAITFIGCSKDADNPNELEGSWTTTARTINGNNELIPGDSWIFNECDDPTAGGCNGTYSVPSVFGTVTSSFTYVIFGNGDQFSIDFSSNSVLRDVAVANIDERTETSIKVNFTDNGDYYEVTLTKD